MNYNKISIAKNNGKTEKIRNLEDFVKYRNGDISLIVPKAKKRKKAL